MQQLTKITIAWELFESGVSQIHIADKLGVNRDTIRLWIKAIKEAELLEFLEYYTNSKRSERSKRKINGLLKVRIYKLREEYRDCCGQKIREFLASEYGVTLSTTTIYKILGEKFKLRSKWKKNQAREPIPEASSPREVIQMDTVDFGAVFAFTGVDIFSREVNVKLYPSLTAKDGLDFLRASFNELPRSRADGVSSRKFFCEPFILAASCEVLWFKNRSFHHTNLLQTDRDPEFRSNVFIY